MLAHSDEEVRNQLGVEVAEGTVTGLSCTEIKGIAEEHLSTEAFADFNLLEEADCKYGLENYAREHLIELFKQLEYDPDFDQKEALSDNVIVSSELTVEERAALNQPEEETHNHHPFGYGSMRTRHVQPASVWIVHTWHRAHIHKFDFLYRVSLRHRYSVFTDSGSPTLYLEYDGNRREYRNDQIWGFERSQISGGFEEYYMQATMQHRHCWGQACTIWLSSNRGTTCYAHPHTTSSNSYCHAHSAG